MASDPLDPFALNIRGVGDLVENSTNKVPTNADGNPEGVISDKYDALALDMSDEYLLRMRDEYEKRYAGYEGKMKSVWEKNYESYMGKRKDGQWLSADGPVSANLQFEAEETFLSAALSKNPEPVVYADNTPEGNAVATAVKTMLAFHADQLVLRRKLAMMVRQWSIYHLGVIKHGWNEAINDVAIENRKIQMFVFDPDGYVDSYGDFVGYLGERIEVTAEKLIELFPESKEYIETEAQGKLGTKVIYTEWWSADDTFTFTTFKKKVLAKNKNQYFKYPEVAIDPLTGTNAVDPLTGEETMITPRNHFAQPKKPYTFLSVYSLQEQPHDITGNIEQNIANQNIITRSTDQMDYNIGASNNGYAYSEDNFNQETAKQASTARKKGNPILVPSGGPIEKAIMPLPAQPLPESFFKHLEMTKNDLRASWGIQGIISQQPNEDQTARGMILNQAHDTTRIGGGVGDAIEQVADNVFNWLTQLYYVFYDEAHFAAIMGNAKAVEYVTLSSASLDRQLIVSVAPDSLKPKDEVTQMNLAQALFDKGAIGPKTLLKMLDFPNPDEAAADGVLYRIDPATYFRINFPEEFAAMQQAMMQGQAEAAMGMNPQMVGSGQPPEQANGEPQDQGGLAADPASAALSQVQLPQLQKGGPAMK
jgi:hypothetical protein